MTVSRLTLSIAWSAVAPEDTSKSKSASASSSKVAKAAKAGQTPGSSAGKEQRDIGFPVMLGAVIFLGVALIVFARGTRDVEALEPAFGQHWHLGYGIWDCTTESFLSNLEDPQTANSGIHTHGDGVVHIHPYSSTATGRNAKLIRFLEATRTELSDTEMSFPDRPALSEDGATCDGEPAILQVARFAPGQSVASEVITENLSDYRFRADQEGMVIALAPEGADIPPPPTANTDTASAASPNVLRTDGLTSLPNTSGVGFNDDGNLVDADGNEVLDDDGNPTNFNDLLNPEGEGDAEGDSSDGDSPEDG